MRGFPNIPPGLDSELQVFLEGLKEALEVGEGQVGEPGQRYLKVDDLLDLGLVQRLSDRAEQLVAGVNLIARVPVADRAVPPPPRDLVLTAGFNHIHLRWANPQTLYGNHALTVVYRHTEDNVAEAEIIGQVAHGFQYADVSLQRRVDYFYWVRFISSSNIPGPFNAPTGMVAQLSDDPAELLLTLSRKITESELYGKLNSRIDLIDKPGAGLVDALKEERRQRGLAVATLVENDTRLSAEFDEQITAQANKNSAFAQRFTDLASTLNGVDDEQQAQARAINQVTTTANTTKNALSAQVHSVQQLTSTVGSHATSIETHSSSINGLKGQISFKIDNNGHVAGWGLSSTKNTYDGRVHSAIQFVSSTFSIAQPGARSLSFVVDAGGVVMDGAHIKRATINSLQVGNIGVDKISGISAHFLLANIGTGNVTNQYIGNFIGSYNYSNTRGWGIYKSGAAFFHSVYARGNIEASSLKAGVAMIRHANIHHAEIDELLLRGRSITFPASVYGHGGVAPGIGGVFGSVYNNCQGYPANIEASFGFYWSTYGFEGPLDSVAIAVGLYIGNSLIKRFYFNEAAARGRIFVDFSFRVEHPPNANARYSVRLMEKHNLSVGSWFGDFFMLVDGAKR